MFFFKQVFDDLAQVKDAVGPSSLLTLPGTMLMLFPLRLLRTSSIEWGMLHICLVLQMFPKGTDSISLISMWVGPSVEPNQARQRIRHNVLELSHMWYSINIYRIN